MQLRSLELRGFRCFGEATRVEFGDLTALVGTNATGKTAALWALLRMFGTSKQVRTLTRDDFHQTDQQQDPSTLNLCIEARFELPELDDENEAANSVAIPSTLKHIIVENPGGTAYCRVRLTATWSKTRIPEGEIEQNLEWLDSAEPDPPPERVHPMRAVDRSLIQAVYVPASRDATKELRGVSGTILSRALRHITWPESTEQRLLELSAQMAAELRSAARFGTLEDQLREHWTRMRGSEAGSPELSVADTDLVTLLRRLDASVSAPHGPQSVDLLSEGERSLLYFALVAAALAFESQVLESTNDDTSDLPVLTLVAVEEPENHLAPQYLSRIINTLRLIESHRNAQVLLTSHSASILRRVAPGEIRHFRRGHGSPVVSKLTLPSDSEEAHKYVLGAVQRHPELYFAKMVVFGEGASEELVLPLLADAFDIELDPLFVAVVPLGGRHVNHFWRLLSDIGTPYATLLDLDCGRVGGSWARIASVNTELLNLGYDWDEVWATETAEDAEEWATSDPSEDGDSYPEGWPEGLEDDFKVFLSSPLDLDFLLLRAFPEAYKAIVERGPQLPQSEPARTERIDRATRSVLGSKGYKGNVYDDADTELFPWYSHLFISGSKPAKHAEAFAQLTREDIEESCPEVLKRLLDHIAGTVGQTDAAASQ